MAPMRLVTVLGARPQFIKAAPVSRALERHGGVTEVVVHTGQHFDANMSDVFFEQLGIREPDHRLDVHGGTHGRMTGRMLEAVEEVLLAEEPDGVLVYGDTNSTLAGALAAAKLHVPVAHVEAGLRSYDRRMPEEINRVLVDNLSDQLFCPTDTAVANLEREGFGLKPVSVELVGDVMYDAVMYFADRAVRPQGLAEAGSFVLATVHRAENTDNAGRLTAIVAGLNQVHTRLAPVVVPLHPRTAGVIARLGLRTEFDVIPPVGYLEMLWLTKNAELVVTDSGGLQKEAYMLGRACVTLRDSSEWRELVELGANVLVPADADAIAAACREHLGRRVQPDAALYGGGVAAERIASSLLRRLAGHRADAGVAAR